MIECIKSQRPRDYRIAGGVIKLKCSKCGLRKTTDLFFKKKGRQFGVASECKECSKKYATANRERISTRQKQYRESHKDEIREYKQEYRRANLERVVNYFKSYYEANIEKIHEYYKDYKLRRSVELGFSLPSFHSKTRWYVNKNKLRPDICQICGRKTRIETHHPSYESFEKWSEVVFCCSSCHKLIHSGVIECPQPIDLLTEVLDPNLNNHENT